MSWHGCQTTPQTTLHFSNETFCYISAAVGRFAQLGRAGYDLRADYGYGVQLYSEQCLRYSRGPREWLPGMLAMRLTLCAFRFYVVFAKFKYF